MSDYLKLIAEQAEQVSILKSELTSSMLREKMLRDKWSEENLNLAIDNNASKKENEELLTAVKAAYRRYHYIDDSIGWNELGEILLNALCNAMGDEGFQKWLKEGGKCIL